MSKSESVIAIVGAGVAGSFLSWNLALRGHKVFIFDHSVPREKPCGGGINHLAFRRFPNLRDLNFSKNIINKYKFIYADNTQIERSLREPLTIVSRQEFDAALLHQAIKNGAEFYKKKVKRIKFYKNDIIIFTESEEIKADIVVGADGISSTVRRMILGKIPACYVLPAYGYYLKGMTDNIIIIKCFKDIYGYLWVFPRKDHISIGIGGFSKNQNKDHLKDKLNGFLEENFPSTIQKEKWKGLIPIINSTKFYNKPFSGKNWLLIGDASAQVNSITGEGIIYALLSAELAVQVISTQKLSEFSSIWKANFGRILLRNAEFKGRIDRLSFHDRCENYQALFDKIELFGDDIDNYR